ncbi:MAG: ribosomal-processing cysteine protease Prp [Eubacteriales bacterium]|nr:ribosomal-processing cysteine protease Prp [Clostridiales bacterium]
MTKITFFMSGGVRWGFEETGHTGYGESGDDVLCAALSAMTMLIVNAIEVTFFGSVDYVIDEKTTDIKVMAKCALPDYEEDERVRFAVGGLIDAYFYQLMDMMEDYPEHLEVDTIEKDPE